MTVGGFIWNPPKNVKKWADYVQFHMILSEM